MNGDFGTVNPWYYPVTSSSSSYQFYNPNFYHHEYTPPPTPPHVYHHIQPPEPPYQFNTIPQPPSYYTPPTSYTSPYLSDSSGIPCYTTNQHEIQARPNPYHPPLTCFTSPFITTTQFPFGVIDEQQPELVVSQVFDESPHSPELIFNSSNDNNHQMYDKFSEIIQKLEEIGKNLADQSRISKEMPSKKVSQSSHTSKKVSQSSHTLTHVPIVGNLDKSAITEKTGNVDSKQQLDILAPHMFDESPENEYVALDKHFPTTPCAGQVYSDVESSQPTVVEISVESLNYDNRVFDVNSGINVNEKKRIMKLFNDHDDTPVSDEDESKGIANEVWKEIVDEKSGDSTFEGSYDESESPRQIVDFSKGKLDSIRRNRSSGGMLAVNSVFVGVKTVGFENEEEWGVEEIERKDIEDWKVLKSKYTLALRSVDVKRNLDEDEGRSGKVLEVSSLKEVLEDDDMRKNEENNATEESKNSGDQSCEAQYVLPKINGLDDLSNIVCDRILIIFDPGGYKRNVACVVIMLKEMNRSSVVGLYGIAKVISACSVVNVREDMGSKVMNRRERFESKRGIEGGRATHDCSHFVTLIGDLESIKKIYDEMFGTYNEDKNARISDMGKQKYVGESFEVFDYMYKKHLYSWNLRMTRYSKMRNMEPARLLFDDSSGKKVELEKKVRFESNSINLLNILSIGRHGGLIYELQPFTKMVTACGKVSGIKLYGCFIDMPGRSERLNEVDNRTIDLLNKLVIVVYWITRVKMGKRVMRRITLDEITNSCILSACARKGLVKEVVCSFLNPLCSLMIITKKGWCFFVTSGKDDLHLNIDISFTKILQRMSIISFLVVNQNVKNHEEIYVVKKNGKENVNARDLCGKLVSVPACYFVIHLDIRNVKLNDAGACNFLNLLCSRSELEMSSVKIGSLGWTLKCVEDALSLEPVSGVPIVDGIYALVGQDEYKNVLNEVGFSAINLHKFVQFLPLSMRNMQMPAILLLQYVMNKYHLLLDLFQCFVTKECAIESGTLKRH